VFLKNHAADVSLSKTLNGFFSDKNTSAVFNAKRMSDQPRKLHGELIAAAADYPSLVQEKAVNKRGMSYSALKPTALKTL